MREVDILDLINRAVTTAVQRAVRSVISPKCLFGSVVVMDLTRPGIHEVLLDGDDSPVAAMNMTGFSLAVGSRVAIIAAPPHQFWIVGNLGRCVQSGSTTVTFSGTQGAVFSVTYPFPFGGTPEVFGTVSGNATSVAFGVRTNNVDTTGFDVLVNTVDGSTVTGDMIFQWLAAGPPI